MTGTNLAAVTLPGLLHELALADPRVCRTSPVCSLVSDRHMYNLSGP
jgi:hypothetical protein